MQYPRPTMTIKELVAANIMTRSGLMDIYNTPNQIIAWKMNPYKKTSPILFDTEALEKHRQKLCRLSNPR